MTSVSLRGSFNDWGEWPMEKQPDGTWAITVCLAPGEYQYKYYINGQWPKDMSTGRGGGPVDLDADGYADDGFGGKNAIRKVGSYISGKWDFKLKLIPSIAVDNNELDLTYSIAGFDFNSITKFGDEQGFTFSGLVLGQYDLTGGMWFDINAVKYKYAFVEAKGTLAGIKLDAKAEHWAEGYLPDDRCPVAVTFRYVPAQGETVTWVKVAGDFTDWGTNPVPMTYNPSTNEWSVTVYLTPGPHQYKYLLSDKATPSNPDGWVGNMSSDHPVSGGPVDPDADGYVDDGLGGQNAVRIVRANCPRADTVPVTFRYVPAQNENVTWVNVAGDLTGWSQVPMSYNPSTGEWSVTINVPPGIYHYKYVLSDVPGNWPGNMATDHPVTGGPIDPDADGYADDGFGGKNAVRLVGDPMHSYLRYTLSAEWNNFQGTLRFEDCCCGTMFKDLTLSLSDMALCCDINYDAELYFTKHGFQHLKFSVDNLFSPCCDLTVGLDVVFGVDYKQVTPRFSWGGISGCLNVYGNFTTSDLATISGFELYGFKLRCDLGDCNYLEVLTALNVAKIEEILNADIFQGNEFEYVKLGFCGQACCGGNWDLTVTTFFGGGGLFDITRIWLDSNIPLNDSLKLVVNFSPTLPELHVGWTWNF